MRWLLKPYPFEIRWRSGLKNGLWTGLFVTFFLFFIRPFGTQVAEGKAWSYFWVCGAFGLITFFMTLLANGFCMVLPSIFDEEKWKVWKEILFNLFFIGCIGMGNLMLAHILWNVPLNGNTFLGWQGLTFAVGFFPTVLGAFFTQLKLSKKYTSEAATLHLPAIHPTHAAPVTLIGDNQKEILTLQADQVAYLASHDNYVQVFYFEKEELKSRMIRATMRKMEDALAEWPQFLRCHRTYVVNFDRIEKVSGNAQGYRLHLTGVEETVPVSRNLNEAVRQRLQA